MPLWARKEPLSDSWERNASFAYNRDLAAKANASGTVYDIVFMGAHHTAAPPAATWLGGARLHHALHLHLAMCAHGSQQGHVPRGTMFGQEGYTGSLRVLLNLHRRGSSIQACHGIRCSMHGALCLHAVQETA